MSAKPTAARAESAILARDHLLDIVLHELRSPLNGIKSWTHVLENHLHEDDDPAMKRAVAGILIGVEEQVRLIDDLLDVTRALSGTLELAKQPMALAPALIEAVEGLRAVAVEKGVQLVADPSRIDAQVHGDFERVHQIFANLLGNAIKFTPAGGTVWLTAAVDGAMARVEVRDSGAGIAAEFLPYVFDLFRQAEHTSASSRRQQRLGLGLALVQRLVELHGGHVTCESEGDGRGATFRVYLPLRREDRARQPARAAVEFQQEDRIMAGKDRTDSNDQDRKRARDVENQRPEPDTLEGPGGKRETKGEEDERNKTTRRGER